MTTTSILRALRRGATIYHGAFCGWYVRYPSGKRGSVTNAQLQELIESGKVIRIDDRSTRCGEEWAAKP